MDKNKLAFIIITILLLSYSVYNKQRKIVTKREGIIVYNQLSTVHSSINFTEEIRALTQKMKWSQVILNDSDVSVDRLKNAPDKRIIVFRTHSGVFEGETWIFTGEEYQSSKHVIDQLKGLVHIARCSSTSQIVFATGESFFYENWGELHDSLVILMGCDGGKNHGWGEKMVNRGAAGVIGWDGPVSLSESDEVVLEILGGLAEGRRLGEIIDECDSGSGVSVVYYPVSLRSYRLPQSFMHKFFNFIG